MEKEAMIKVVRAREIMTRTVITATAGMPLTEVISLLLRWHISGLPVVDDEGRVTGIISEHDLVNLAMDGNAEDTTVEEVMTRQVVSFPPDAPIADIARCFSERRLRRVPIVEEGRLVGIISRRDILRELLRRYGVAVE
ncbi:MAG TPA: CBS domain-containing protein [Kiritimatiellae bacterium]|nr:CBS domain-containing protein [Kiritimatiellia bacterium]